LAYQNLLFDVQDRVATVRLNRPMQLNALSQALVEELIAVFDAVAEDDAVGAVVMTGEGRGFCSGADLAAAASRSAGVDRSELDIGIALEQQYNPLVKKIHALPKPVIAAVNGMAAGAGCSLALMADLTIAARSAKFLQAFVNIGLMPDAGGTWILPRLAGPQRALGFALLGESIKAEQAKEWGLVWDVVDDDQLLPSATALAKRLAAGPAQALARIKFSLQAGAKQSLDQQLQLEREWQRDLGRTEDFMEGVGAFLQKRKAQFKGR
jgi:2-(1,2-epoxy-1,2-dihydrophenyl)acetyl-CoA isomerase